MPKKPTIGQWIVFGGGLLVFIALFLPWFTAKVSYQGFSEGSSGNAFDFALGWLGSLVVLAAAVLIALKVFANLKFGAGPLKVEHLALALAGLGTLLILIKMIIGEGLPIEIQAMAADYGIEAGISRGAGIFIALIAGLAVTAGSFMCMKEAGLGFGAFKSIGGAGAPPPPPPPPEA